MSFDPLARAVADLQREVEDLKQRMKSHDEFRDTLISAMIQAPKPLPKEQAQLNAPVEPQQQKKDFFATDQLHWQPYPETDWNAGRWEKSTDFGNPQFTQILNALSSAGKQLHSTQPNALYWLLTDNEDPSRVTGIGRRLDEWRKKR